MFKNYFILLLIAMLSFSVGRSQTVIIDPAGAGGFELGSDFTSNGWTVVNGSPNTWNLGTVPGWFTGARGAYVSNDAGTSWTYTNNTATRSHFYKNITVPSGETNITLTFDLRTNGNDGSWDNLLVYICDTTVTPNTTGPTSTNTTTTGWTGYTNGTTGYYLLQRNGTTVPTTTTAVSYTLTAAQAAYLAVGTPKRIVFTWKNDGSGGTNPPASVDNISLTSSCVGAATAAATSITSSGATLNATAFTGATGYNFRYRMVGATTWIDAPGNPYATNSAAITGFSSNTNYQFQVSAVGPVCNAWSNSATFTTLCSSFVPYYLQDFASYVPGCWSEATGAPTPAPTGTTSGWLQDDFGNVTANGKCARVEIWSTGGREWLISPVFDLSAGGYELNFDVALTNYGLTTAATIGADDTVFLMQSIDGGATWTSIYSWNSSNSPSTTGNFTVIDVSALTSANTKFAFYSFEGATSGGDLDFFIDNFVVRVQPTCPQPSALTTPILTTTSAALSWTSGGSSQWILEYGPVGFTQGTGTLLVVSSSPDTILSGLTTGNSYDYYVRDYCTPGDTSFAVKGSFSLNYCTPAPSSVDGIGITNVSFGQVVEFVNNTTVAETGNYGNYTAMIGDAQQSLTLDVSITLQTGFTYNLWAWIDWNDNFQFEANETFYLGESPITNPTTFIGHIPVPLTAPLGNHRIRIGGADSGLGTTPPSFPCYTGTWATFEDYTVHVLPAPSCLAPTNIVAQTVSSDSALVYFTPFATAGSVVVEYGSVGFTQGTGMVVTTTNDSIYLTGLSSSSTYSVYVYSDCYSTTNDSSLTAGPFSFTTDCAPVSTYPYFENFETGANGWISGGSNSSWQLATPANTVINSAYSGVNSWITNASGSYNASENSWVRNCFDFSTLINPEISMGVWWNSEFSWDGAKLQSSIDGGATWQDVGAFGDANNWYTDNSVNGLAFSGAQIGWSGRNSSSNGSGSWKIARHQLTGLGGQANVLLRIAFGSDGSVQDNGFAFDDVSIYDVTCFEPTTFAVSNVTNVSADLSWFDTLATTWAIEYGAPGFTPGTGTFTLASSSTTQLTGLNSNTMYNVYVRAICAAGDSSFWVGPLSFTTLKSNDVGVSAIVAPTASCGMENTPFTVTVQNFGVLDQFYIPVVIQVSGDFSAYLSYVVDTLASGATVNITLDSLNTLAGGSANITAFTALSTDQNTNNDALSTVVEFGAIPATPAIADMATCLGSSVTLNATTNVNWYLASNDSMLATDSVLTVTPSMDTWYTYEAMATVTANVGSTTAPTNGFTTTPDWGLRFFANADFTLNTVTLYPSGTGMIDIAILDDATETVLMSTGMQPISDGGTAFSPVVFPLGFDIPANVDDYRIVMKNFSGLTSLGRNSSGNTYPYSSPNGEVVIVNGSTGAPNSTSTSYYWFFNWNITVNGCVGARDSVMVAVNTNYNDTLTVTACDSMMIAGMNQTMSGFYTDSLMSASGCDSIVVYNLTINNSTSGAMSDVFCAGSTYTLPDGSTVSAAGTYDVMLTNAEGCDSLLSVTLNELMPASSMMSATICSNGSYTLPDGMVVTDAGTYTSTLSGAAANGCDSVVTTTVSVVNTFSVSQNVLLCANDTLVVGTSSYTATGTYTDALMSVAGCDSIVTTNLVVFPASNVSIGGVGTICENAGTIDLSLSPVGGTLSGDGVTGTSFDPAVAGVGTHVLTYTYSDDNGCNASASLEVEVIVCTGIKDISGIETIAIFPNPYSEVINLQFEDKDAGDLNIKLFDITGRLVVSEKVQTQTGNNTIALRVPEFAAAGVSIIQIERDGNTYQQTLIKK